MPAIPLTEALRLRAEEDPSRPAISQGNITLTRRQVVELSDLMARRLYTLGVSEGSVVAMTGSNSASLLILFFAVWKVGAVPLPLHSRKPRSQLQRLISDAQASVAVGFDEDVVPESGTAPMAVSFEQLLQPGASVPLPEVAVSPHLRIGVSGGSTGPSKLIVVDSPAIVSTGRPWHFGMQPGGTHVVALELVDGTGFVASINGLALGCHLVLMDSFEPERMLALIESYRADWIALAQPQLMATAKLTPEVRAKYDLSSLRMVTHYSGGVAAWVKRTWIDWLGAERIAENYGATDARGSTWIDGTSWLTHPGSVGRVLVGSEIAIMDDRGNQLEPGEVGHIFIRDLTGRRNFHYIGEKPPTSLGGWETVGDIGKLDHDGYLYVVDRARDMIQTVNGPVAPLPIEGAIEFDPSVRSAVVIGLPGAKGHERIHAIVDTAGNRVEASAIKDMLKTHFPDITVPQSWEFTDAPLRDEAGKALRQQLRADRLTGDYREEPH